MASTRRRLSRLFLTGRQVNLLLEGLIALSILTGLGSWMVPNAAARPLLFAHAVAGLVVVFVAPLKIRGPVQTGMRRRRATRWVSIGVGLLVVATIGLGWVHSTGLWHGVGEWSALWTHLLLGFVAAGGVVWHIADRPVRPRAVDLNRRAALTTTVTTLAAAGAVVLQETAVDALGLDGATRAGTGSHEIASFDPDRMPVVSWFDDTTPEIDLGAWPLRINGEPVDVADLASRTRPLTAALDCTGGWRSRQHWDVVPLSELMPTGEARSIRITSATGYARLFSPDDADRIYVATGYDGRRLRSGHGAPLRVVAPGRRGPWWVKWVVEIEPSRRPTWTQLPFPPT